MQLVIRFCTIAIAVAAALLSLGSGVSVADSYVGKTYKDASSKITERGYTPVISTVVGDQLSTDDCIVTSSRKASYTRDDNFDHGKDYLVSLNCSAPLAHGGEPGNSLASPQGRAEKWIEQKSETYNSKPERCAQNLDSCKNFCTKYDGRCSSEVMALF